MEKLQSKFPFNLFNKKKVDFGRHAEKLAADYLKKKAYRILEKNYNCRFGEIDIIAKTGDTICFVEVKARTNLDFGPPSLFVTPKKQTKIKKTALTYIKDEELDKLNYRFDVISIIKSSKNIFEIELIKGAF